MGPFGSPNDLPSTSAVGVVVGGGVCVHDLAHKTW
jgi:hypothetical protein